MFVDLNDTITRFLVQEYLNKIVNAGSDAELNFDVHKLIHTFEVVKMAESLIDKTTEPLSDELKTQIKRGAMVHDVGRCYEFKNGQKVPCCDHGKMGATLLKRAFPNLEVLIKSTELHNKLPSDDDPAWAYPVLGYVRDADILGNIAYQIKHMPVFLGHLRDCWPKETDLGYVLDDIKTNVANRHIRPTPQGFQTDLLNMLLHQLTWIFILATPAAYRIAKEQSLFSKMRDVLIDTVMPILSVDDRKKQALKQDILSIFPDSVFEKEFINHGI